MFLFGLDIQLVVAHVTVQSLCKSSEDGGKMDKGLTRQYEHILISKVSH